MSESPSKAGADEGVGSVLASDLTQLNIQQSNNEIVQQKQAVPEDESEDDWEALVDDIPIITPPKDPEDENRELDEAIPAAAATTKQIESNSKKTLVDRKPDYSHLLLLYSCSVTQGAIQALIQDLFEPPFPKLLQISATVFIMVCGKASHVSQFLEQDAKFSHMFQTSRVNESSPCLNQVSTQDILPVKERPKTTSMVANRLVASALNTKPVVTEKDRKDAKEVKQKRASKYQAKLDQAKGYRDVWES